jgi:hypothetical protein
MPPYIFLCPLRLCAEALWCAVRTQHFLMGLGEGFGEGGRACGP